MMYTVDFKSSVSTFRREWTPSETIWTNNTFASSADGSTFKHELLGDDIEAIRWTWCFFEISGSYWWKIEYMDRNWTEFDYWYWLDLFIISEANNYADKVVLRHYVSVIPFCYECQLFGFE